MPAPEDSVLPATTKSPPPGIRVTAFAVFSPAPPNVRFQTSPPVSFTLTTQAEDSFPPSRGLIEPTKT